MMKNYTLYRDENSSVYRDKNGILRQDGRSKSSNDWGDMWLRFQAENMDAAKKYLHHSRYGFKATWYGGKPPRPVSPPQSTLLPLPQSIQFHDQSPSVVLVMDEEKVWWLDQERVH